MNRCIFSGLFLFLTFCVNAQLNNSGAIIVIESGAKLIVEGDVTNTGTITNNGELEIQGNLDNDNIITNAAGSKMIFSGSGNSLITSTSVLDIKELVLNKTGGASTILDPVGGNNVLLSFALTFGANNFLSISNFDLTLGGIANPILNAANDRFIITNGSGSVIRPNLSNAASFTFPVGFSETEYNPVTVTNKGVAANIGARSLQEAYSTGDDTNSAPAPDAVTASWEVTGGGDLDVEFSWDGTDEPGSFDASRSGVSRWDDINGFWDLTIEDGLGVVGTSASRAGVTPGIFSVGGESVMDYILVLPKVMLSGAYNSGSGQMNTNLTSMLPGGEPYNGLGFSHAGLGGGETSSDFTDVVDWVFVEIRDGSNPSSIIGTCSALLKKNGDIVPTASSSELMMPGFDSAKSYYVAIRHRNHLAVMSKNPISASRVAAVTYDMVNNDVYGTNGAMQSNGIYQMYGGDVNGDGYVYYQGVGNDRDALLTFLGQNQLGYINSYNTFDVNLDQYSYYQGVGNDRDAILTFLGQNQLGYLFSQIP